LDIVSIRR